MGKTRKRKMNTRKKQYIKKGGNNANAANASNIANDLYTLTSATGSIKSAKSWKQFQQENEKFASHLFESRKKYIEWLNAQMLSEILQDKNKPIYVKNVRLLNAGSNNITSDIDVNTFIHIDINKFHEYFNQEVYANFLRAIVDVFIGNLEKASQLWLSTSNKIEQVKEGVLSNIMMKGGIAMSSREETSWDAAKVFSKALDVNYYPPGPFFEGNFPETKLLVSVGAIRSFKPQFSQNKAVVFAFLKNEFDNLFKKDKVYGPEELKVMEYYESFKVTSLERGSKCYKNHKSVISGSGVASCLSQLMDFLHKSGTTNIISKDDDRIAWNDLLCCIVGINKFGSELYFTYSSILFVVFHLQMGGEIDDETLRIICIPAYIEQLIFYQLHNQNKKYMSRAINAKNIMDNDLFHEFLNLNENMDLKRGINTLINSVN